MITANRWDVNAAFLLTPFIQTINDDPFCAIAKENEFNGTKSLIENRSDTILYSVSKVADMS